ncbi:MAG: septum formation initiator family protein [Bryobacteraceae bacterium]
MRTSAAKIAYTAGLLLALAYAIVTIQGPRGIPAWIDKRREIRELEESNAALARENQLKRERLERLRGSQAEQELEIRRRLKLVRPEEKVFILDRQKSGH